LNFNRIARTERERERDRERERREKWKPSPLLIKNIVWILQHWKFLKALKLISWYYNGVNFE
jgi:hypothetical protein